MLSDLYECELNRRGIQNVVLAYRRIALEKTKSGKCNIHFARDAFDVIRGLKNCEVFALDIHQFFENLDHEQLKKLWSSLLTGPRPANKNWLLPPDHFRVFSAVTKYSWIDVDRAYKTLDLIGDVKEPSGRTVTKFKVPRALFPLQICTPRIFREKLLPLAARNETGFGVPQGSPISDLLANLYMLDFDQRLNELAVSLGGKYFRYSDDVLLVVPTAALHWQDVIARIKQILAVTSPRLNFKDEKTQVFRYRPDGELGQLNEIISCEKSIDGLEYLGFRYDGKRVFIKDKTISGVHRKITASAQIMVGRLASKNPSLNKSELLRKFNYSLLIQKFGRVKDFEDEGHRYTTWTFWTYVKRSSKIFGELGSPIMRQFKTYKGIARKKATDAILKRKK
jgi:hypothetical protein